MSQTIELEAVERGTSVIAPSDEPTNPRRLDQELAPIDGGTSAWRLLWAAFVFETLLWGKHIPIQALGSNRKHDADDDFD